MKRYLLGSIFVLAVLAVTAGLVGSQLGRVQSRHNLQIAGDGTGPIPTCRPGTNCSEDDQLKQIASQTGDARVKLEGLFGSNEKIPAELS